MAKCPQYSAVLGLALGVALAAGCRAERGDTQDLLTARDLGLTDLQRGRLPEAEAQFKKVVALAPRDPLGYANLGLTYLRAGRYAEAEPQLRRARRLDPANPEIGLIAARLYALTGRPDRARETLAELPRDARVLYGLAELAGKSPERLREVLALAPANLAVRLELVDQLVRRGEADSAVRHLEDVRRLRPEPPREAKPHLDAALQELRAGRSAEARAPLDRFLRLMELTAPYQASLSEVKGIEGPLVGRPVLAFAPQTLLATRGLAAPDHETAVRFTDVTGEAGLSDRGILPTALALGDYDGDGTDNLLVGIASPAAGSGGVRLYNVQGGFVADVTAGSGLSLPSGAAHASFADFDNDGWLDLYAIGGDGRGRLLRNGGDGTFVDVTAAAGVAEAGGARRARFVDLDHDGDLDLLLVGGAANHLYRNNLDGTFTEIAAAAGIQGSGSAPGQDAAFGDFDDDGRVDVFVARAGGADALYRNAGLQRFQDVAASSGLAGSGASGAVAVGDYDNDGMLDVFVVPAGGPAGGEAALWRNDGTGRFTRDRRSAAALRRLQDGGRGAEFVDYDNDGWLDLVVAGRRGPALFHNDRTGRYEDRTNLLPATGPPGGAAAAIAVSDVDGDGDRDLFVADSGGVHLLRNDGGNANLSMQVQLIALRTGSGKNNNFGIGAMLRVRAGEIYQTRVVTERVTHFGLGPHLKADVLRVQWTNGVPETIYFPGTDEDVLELEQLKGSCAFLYTWDGKGFRFVTDVMWRSALGMPLGLMGGGGSGATYAPAGASQEYLRIPGDALRQRDGSYVLKVTEELWETAYLDELRLLAVDHPDSVEIFVDERFVPPGPVELRLFRAAGRRPPLSATNERGEDLLAALRAADDVYVSNLTPTAYQGLVEPHDLVLDLGEEAGRDGTWLFLRGWIYPTDASINVALSQQTRVRTQPPSLEVRDARGRWKTAIPNLSFPSGKDKTMVVDLAGLFPTRDHRVRIRTNLQIYWDHAFVARDAEASSVHITPLTARSADLHFRGFSRMYRRGGRYGPHWFDYQDARKESPWRPIEGTFTRFGDVLPLLRSADDRYVVMAPGDEVTIAFDAAPAGTVPPGWQRTFLLYTNGWIKDADLNTAFGNTVEPLPFHAIRQYPYAPGESYPSDTALERYRREYNTRRIGRR